MLCVSATVCNTFVCHCPSQGGWFGWMSWPRKIEDERVRQDKPDVIAYLHTILNITSLLSFVYEACRKATIFPSSGALNVSYV